MRPRLAKPSPGLSVGVVSLPDLTHLKTELLSLDLISIDADGGDITGALLLVKNKLYSLSLVSSQVNGVCHAVLLPSLGVHTAQYGKTISYITK